MKNRFPILTVAAVILLSPGWSLAKPMAANHSSEDDFERTLASEAGVEDAELFYAPDEPETPEAEAEKPAPPPDAFKESKAIAVAAGSKKKICRPFVTHRKTSYYSNDRIGRKTASGLRFSNKELTAAHPTLPMGSVISVTNPRTGASIEVTVIDRGPFKCKRAPASNKRECAPHPNREIDLSQRAYTALFGTTEAGEHVVDIAVCE